MKSLVVDHLFCLLMYLSSYKYLLNDFGIPLSLLALIDIIEKILCTNFQVIVLAKKTLVKPTTNRPYRPEKIPVYKNFEIKMHKRTLDLYSKLRGCPQ